ncbi:type I restriction enzyme S subunit [Phycicoccus badiiscoriae]|uniref:Type I restriction enzyme S subunit n=1 Tax=Pedococcus badiiscoriae TaxID=642776 RepID=A0A852WL38_9MICO|nr:restriction endonuclease subunit S [Pedococcus badiiscoriae]NYG06915.1 type I restriction enzyme S subunit [Pedococcus badiiscoriae]
MSWNRATLAALLETTIGGVWGGEAGSGEVDVRVIRVTELKNHGRLNVSTAALRSISKRQLLTRELRPGDLLLEKSGGGPTTPVGRVGLVMGLEEPSICANFMQLLRPDQDQVEPRFLHFYLNHFHASGLTATMQTASTNIRNIKASEYVRLEVPLPCLDEQRRIVEILEDHLSRLDAADAGLVDAQRRMAVLRERLVRDAITGSGVSGQRHAPDLIEAGTRDGDLPTLPVGWAWRRLGEVADVAGGVTKDANKQSNPDFVEVPYLRVANVQRAELRLENVTTIRVAPSKAEALRLEPGDVLLNEGGDRDKLARGWVWAGQVDDCIHQNHVFRARVRGDLDPYFLSWTANTIGGRWAERNGKQSVNLASISLSMIRRMPVIVPPGDLSRAIVEELHGQLASVDRVAAELKSARTRCLGLRRALLAAAFSGRLTGRHADQEVIEELADV